MYEDDEDENLYSEIAKNLWQGGTAQYETTYQGQKRLPAMNDPKPFDVVVSLNSYALPVGWLVKELRYGFADGPLDPQLIERVEEVADWAYSEFCKTTNLTFNIRSTSAIAHVSAQNEQVLIFF